MSKNAKQARQLAQRKMQSAQRQARFVKENRSALRRANRERTRIHEEQQRILDTAKLAEQIRQLENGKYAAVLVQLPDLVFPVLPFVMGVDIGKPGGDHTVRTLWKNGELVAIREQVEAPLPPNGEPLQAQPSSLPLTGRSPHLASTLHLPKVKRPVDSSPV